MNFKHAVGSLYYLATNKRLRADYLRELIGYLHQGYANLRKPVTHDIAQNYVRACVQGLVDFSQHIHPVCLESPETKSLFHTVHAARDFIATFDPENKDPQKRFVFKEGQYEAFRALGKPLDDFLYDEKATVTMPLYFSPISDPGNCPFDYTMADKSEKRVWDKKVHDWQKADHKASDEAYAELTALATTMLGTPLFALAHYGENILPDFEVQLPFDVPDDIRFRGVFCCAPQGRGKSNLLRTMVEADRKKKGCIILMDAKGDLINCYRDKALVIQPSLIDPPQINPLALGSSTQSVDLLEYVFSSVLENKLTPVQSTIFHSVLSLATLIPNATIATVTDILREGPKKYDTYVRQLDEEDQKFFFKDWDERNYKERRPEILQRIRLLTRNPYIRAMLNTKKNTIDFGTLMDGQNLIVIDNSYDPDMLGDLGCEFFGRLVIALVRAAAFKRASLPEEEKNPVYFYIDEAHTVCKRDATIASILRQCRSQKIAMTFANQALMDYDETVRGALMDCGVFMVNPGAEAPHWVQRLNLSTEGVQVLRNLPTHTFATFVEGQTRSAVNISVDWLELPTTRRKPEVIPMRPQMPLEPEDDDGDSPLQPSEKY